MEEKKNANEGMLWSTLCKFSSVFEIIINKSVGSFGDNLFLVSYSILFRYLRRKADWKRMKRNKKRCGKESVNTRRNGKEHESRGLVFCDLIFKLHFIRQTFGLSFFFFLFSDLLLWYLRWSYKVFQNLAIFCSCSTYTSGFLYYAYL